MIACFTWSLRSSAVEAVRPGGGGETLISSAADFPATGKSYLVTSAGPQKQKHCHPGPACFPLVLGCRLSGQGRVRVQGRVGRGSGRETCHARHICNYPHPLKVGLDRAPAGVYTKWKGAAWQSTDAGGSSVPEAACSTWRQIKPAWCTATTVNMPAQERQRGRSPTELLLGSCSGSGC